MLTSLALLFLVGLGLAAVFERLKLPRILGMLLAGVLLGPCAVNVLDAPLLFECGMQRYTDETWLVVCRTETRLRRIAARDGLAEEDIQKRIANQMSTEQKEKLADYIIDNSRDLAWLYAQIDTLLAKSEQREKNG